MLRTMLAFLCAMVGPAAALAVEAPLTILTPAYGQAAMLDLKASMEARIGAPVAIEIVGTGGIPERILKGDKIDLVVTHRESLAGAAVKERIQAQIDVAISNVGIAVADDASLPVLKTAGDVAAFLRAIPSLAHSTSLSGQHMTLIIEKLGLTTEMKSKVQTGAGVLGRRVAKGEVAAVAQQISELKLAGLKNIVPLPEALQTDIVLAAATIRGTPRSAEANKVVELLLSPEAAAAYAAAGLKPVSK